MYLVISGKTLKGKQQMGTNTYKGHPPANIEQHILNKFGMECDPNLLIGRNIQYKDDVTIFFLAGSKYPIVAPGPKTMTSSFIDDAIYPASRKDVTQIKYSSQTTTFASKAFNGMDGLTSISGPRHNNLISIADDAFAGCAMLRNIEFGEKTSVANANSFLSDVQLSSVSFTTVNPSTSPDMSMLQTLLQNATVLHSSDIQYSDDSTEIDEETDVDTLLNDGGKLFEDGLTGTRGPCSRADNCSVNLITQKATITNATKGIDSPDHKPVEIPGKGYLNYDSDIRMIMEEVTCECGANDYRYVAMQNVTKFFVADQPSWGHMHAEDEIQHDSDRKHCAGPAPYPNR